ncbi:hypothetical protein EOM81_03265, partial [bacterium]|nr:hypothetical protein [bacterium]
RDIASFSESVTKYCVTTRTNLDSNKGYIDTTIEGSQVKIVSPRGPATGVTDSEIGVAEYNSEVDGNKKVVSWNNGKEKTNKVPKAFDRDDSSEWELSRYEKSSGRRYVQVEYSVKVCVNKFRIYTKEGNVAACELLASDDGSSWVNLLSVDLNKKDSYVDVANTTKYKYYRLNLLTGYDFWGSNKKSKIKEITFYATDVITNTKTVPDTGMHRTLDDNLAPVAVTNNAACTTPYGIMVAGGYAGSGLADSSSNPGTTTALIYWPHAIGGVYEETNDKLYGISRSVPSLPEPSVDNCMVWHKGKVYCFGGTKTSGTTEFHLPFIFDFENNTWAKANSAILGVDHLKRRKAAAVSFGDEIFLFGGECSVTTFAVAWNTSTNVVREVFSAPPAKLGKYNVSAAAFGSHIYLFGGRDSVSTSVGAKNGIYRFTP